MIKDEHFVSINTKWLFGFPEEHFSQAKGDIVTDIRKKISDLCRSVPTEIGKGYRTPEGLWGWMLQKNDVLMDDGKG